METTNTTTTPQKSKVGSMIKSFFWKTFFVLLIIGGLLGYWFYFNVYSDGERTGLLTKFSRKGNVFKTYEGEMMIGNITASNTGLANEKFYFSVANKTIADTLMKIQGRRVTLQYKQYRKSLFWRGDSEYIVDGYSEIANP